VGRDEFSYFICMFLQAFDLVMKSSDLAEKVLANTQIFRKRMIGAGFTVLVSSMCSYFVS